MGNYRATNGRMIARGGNGRFKKVYLTDLMGDAVNSPCVAYVCDKCDYGNKGDWFPLMKSGYCPSCQSKEKHKFTI